MDGNQLIYTKQQSTFITLSLYMTLNLIVIFIHISILTMSTSLSRLKITLYFENGIFLHLYLEISNLPLLVNRLSTHISGRILILAVCRLTHHFQGTKETSLHGQAGKLCGDLSHAISGGKQWSQYGQSIANDSHIHLKVTKVV